MNEALKPALEHLQLHLVNEIESDNILLIFDNALVRDKYIEIQKKKNQCLIGIIPITLEELESSNKLIGTRFKRYHFVTDNEMYDLILEESGV